jgi:O-acetylserine/cysteine efflux transporter
MAQYRLPPLHALLALAVVTVWGTNFVIMKFALGDLPPLTLAALRFTVACLPAVFFFKRPAPWGELAAYGLLIGVGQFGAPALFVLALAVEGAPAMVAGIRGADAATWAAVLWQAVGNSLFGYAAWAWLLARHPAATVSPLALLVPVFGMGASAIFLHEPLSSWKLTAAVLVIGGLALNAIQLRREAPAPAGG